MLVIKQEFIASSGGLVRVSYHDKSKSSNLGLTALAPALTRDDLINIGLGVNDLVSVNTIVHYQGICQCDECSAVWKTFELEYIFD